LQIPSFGKMGEITIDPFLCQACGMCVVECPVRAIDISLDSRNVLAAALKKGLASLPHADQPDGKVVVFIDLYGRFGAQHIAGFKQAYPQALPLMVFGLRRIDVADLLQALQEGAKAVLLLRCPPNRDPFPEVGNKVDARVERARSLLKAIGMDGDRIQLWDMPSEGIVEKERMDAFFSRLSDSCESVPKEAEK
jgi:coenzyme F420-reducing hydrogenase delta subunit